MNKGHIKEKKKVWFVKKQELLSLYSEQIKKFNDLGYKRKKPFLHLLEKFNGDFDQALTAFRERVKIFSPKFNGGPLKCARQTIPNFEELIYKLNFEFGFTDNVLNAKLLLRHGGDIQKVINSYLSGNVDMKISCPK